MTELSRNKAGRISYLRGGEGEPFVFLHGIPGTSLSWEAVGHRLADHYDVIIPDLLGFGESDGAGDEFYFEGQARALKELLGELGIGRLYLAGHNLGFPVVLTLMRMFPELKVNGLVLSNAHAFPDAVSAIPPIIRSLMGSGAYTSLMLSTTGIRLMYGSHVKKKDNLTWERMKKQVTHEGLKTARQIVRRNLGDFEREYRPFEENYEGIEVPTLLLWADQDPTVPLEVGQRLDEMIPNSTLNIYEGVGHFVPEEQPDQVAGDIEAFFG